MSSVLARFVTAALAATSAVLWSAAAPESAVKSPASGGLSYPYFDTAIAIDRLEDQVAVKFRAGSERADMEAAAARLAAAGATSARQLVGGDIALVPVTPAADGGAALAAELAGNASVEWVAPVFRPREAGNFWVATDELILSLRPGDAGEDLKADARFSSVRPMDSAPENRIVTLVAGPGEAAIAEAWALQRSGRFAWVAVNAAQTWQRYATTNDPLLSRQWHLNNAGGSNGNPGQNALADADVDAAEAWDVTNGGSANVVVAVIDDGPEGTHEDLAPNLYVNPGEIPGDGLDNDGNGYVDDVSGWDHTNNDNNPGPSVDADAHGTSVAGVIAARGNNAIGVAGVAHQARWFGSRVFIGGTPTSDANFASAINYASGRGRTGGNSNWRGADITNNSWGGGAPSAALTSALQWGANGTGNSRAARGVVHFFATGNGSNPTTISYPASLASTEAHIIAVGASNDLDQRSTYSNAGVGTDFLAPSNGGTYSIVTTDRSGALGYDGSSNYAGFTSAGTGFGSTSSATPLAAGIGALILSQNSNLTASEVRGLLRGTTDLIGPTNIAYSATYNHPTLGNIPGWNSLYGFGRLNAHRALTGIGVARLDLHNGRTRVESGGTLSVQGVNQVPMPFSIFIRNTGTVPVTLSAPSLEPGPVAVANPLSDTVLTAGETSKLDLVFTSSVPGTTMQVLTIGTSIAGQPTVTVVLEGSSVPRQVAGRLVEDVNGSGTADAVDRPLAGRELLLDRNGNGQVDYTSVVSGPLSLGIPDANTVGISHSLNVSGTTGSVGRVRVRLNVTHAYISDLYVDLTGPDGTTIRLLTRVGGTGDNFASTMLDDAAVLPISAGTAPFSGSFRPETPLATFQGRPANGTWTLTVRDAEAPDVGTLTGWTIEVTDEFGIISDATGSFLVTNAGNGVYTLVTGVPAGFVAVTPQPTSYPITITNGSESAGRDFIFVRPNAAYGRVFNDSNGNGMMDSGENALGGFPIFLDEDQDGSIGTTIQSVASTDVPKSVPDASTVGANSTLSSALPRFIRDINVSIGSFTHTWMADMAFDLLHPDGTSVSLFSRRGGSGDNLTNTVFDDEAALAIASGTAPFTGSFRPETPLSVFDGKPAAGIFTLRMVDLAGGDVGALNSWSIQFTSGERTVWTDANGFYVVPGLPPGVHHLRPDLGTTWSQTAPTFEQPRAFNMASGATAYFRDFGVTSTITASVVNVSSDRTSDNPITFRVTFSQPVTGITAADFTVTNGSVAGVSGSGTTYSVTVTPNLPGIVGLTVVANAATEGNHASKPGRVVYRLPALAR